MKITSPWIDDIFTRFKIISWITLTLESSCNEQNNKRPNFLSKKRKMLTININIFCLQINYPLKSTSLTNNVISKIDMLVAKSKGYILKLKPWIPHPPKRKSKRMYAFIEESDVFYMWDGLLYIVFSRFLRGRSLMVIGWMKDENLYERIYYKQVVGGWRIPRLESW